MPTLPGGTELIVILFIVLLLFGARKLPGLASAIGTSVREFRQASGTGADESDELAHGAGEPGPPPEGEAHR